MTAILDRVPIEQISAEARQIRFRRILLVVLAGLFYGLGWAAAKTLGAVWLGLAWVATAVKVGWVEARAGRRVRGAA